MQNQKILDLLNEANDSKFVKKMEHCPWSIIWKNVVKEMKLSIMQKF